MARAVFPAERLGQAVEYARWLAGPGVERGLIGPRETDRLWSRHIVNCAVVHEVIPANARVVDLGSGAGLPGVPLAIARPDLSVTLVEPLERRWAFLTEVISALGLEVELIRGRAESVAEEQRFDVVTSRALAPLDRLLGWSMPLVSPEGAMVAMKGRTVTDEVDAARGVLRRLRCAEPEIMVLGGTLRDLDPEFSPTTVIRVAHADPTQVALPRSRPAGQRTAGRDPKRSRQKGTR